ncbi:MAG: hypothetical protein A2X64_08945 [Ignavibacteria bacterium GWF2_33_9]|nr:MAG: hypothetical protein A2X64_08945 [Ignavibacteria bacterium GWF2_33_9]
MILPDSGKIIIIDDNVEQALPLIQLLSKKKIPVIYYNNDKDFYPSDCIDNIRIIFLDLQLTANTDEKTIVSLAKQLLNKLVNNNNPLYLLIVWSLKEKNYPDLITELNTLPNKPAYILTLNKADYFNQQNINTFNEEKFIKTIQDDIKIAGDFDVLKLLSQTLKENLNKFEINTPQLKYILKDDVISLIEKKLKEELEKAGMFQLFIIWENLVNNAAGNIVNQFSGFYPFDDNWNKNISAVFYNLAKAYSGKTLDEKDKNEIIKNSLFTFNATFIDNLENLILNSKDLTDCSINFDVSEIPNEVKSKINSKILLIENIASIENVIPGLIFKIEDSKKKQNLVEYILNVKPEDKQKVITETILIECEISPICDYIQDKKKYNRFLTGILCPAEFKKFIKTADYLYKSNMELFLIGKIFILIFDYRLLHTSENSAELPGEKICVLRKEIFNEIQSGLVKHINRYGVLYL